MRIFAEIADWAENNVPLIGGWIASVIMWINDKLEPFLDMISLIWNILYDLAYASWMTVSELFRWMYNSAKSAYDWVVNNGSWIINWILNEGTQLWNWFVNTATYYINLFADIIKTLWNLGFTVATLFFTWVYNTLVNAWNWIVEKGTWLLSWVIDKGIALWNWVSNEGQHLWNWLSNDWNNFWRWIQDGINYAKWWIDTTGKWLKDRWDDWNKEWPTWRDKISWFWDNWPRTPADLVNILTSVYKEAFIYLADVLLTRFIQDLMDIQVDAETGEVIGKVERSSINALLSNVEVETE